MDEGLLQHYWAPELTPEEATPVRVRDELVRCFMSAMSCLPMPEGVDPRNPTAMRMEVEHFVRSAFERNGASYDRPTKRAILGAMETCRASAEKMSMPQDLMMEHWGQMMKVVDQMAA